MLLFGLDRLILGALLLSSSAVIQSAAVLDQRNSITHPETNPNRWVQNNSRTMRIPAIYFLVIYLGSIFLFAFVYSLMSYSFYHATVKYEATIVEGTKEIEPDLLAEIRDNLRTYPDSDTVIIDGANFSVKNIGLTNLTVKDYSASFSMHMTNISTKSGEIISLSNYHINFNDYDSYEEGHAAPHTIYIYEDEPLPYWYGGRIGFLFEKITSP